MLRCNNTPRRRIIYDRMIYVHYCVILADFLSLNVHVSAKRRCNHYPSPRLLSRLPTLQRGTVIGGRPRSFRLLRDMWEGPYLV